MLSTYPLVLLSLLAPHYVSGSYKIMYHADGHDQPPIEIDFTPPFRRISMVKDLEVGGEGGGGAKLQLHPSLKAPPGFNKLLIAEEG